jgi:pimeloyl-ACP methyl ester carboxylesterase
MFHKLLLITLIIFLNINITSFAQDNIFEKITFKEPPGKMININSHSLHMICKGEGEITVILESGIGANMLDWVKIIPEVSRTTKVCAYDRGGYGWSDRGPKPRLTSVLAEELNHLLQASNLSPPYIMVGHSFGGLIVQYFAYLYPELIKSIILIDSMHPQQFQLFEKAGIDIPTSPSRGLIYASRDVLTYGFPEHMKDIAYQLASSDKTRSFMFNELRNLIKSSEEVQTITLPDLPLTVLVHGNNEWKKIAKNGTMEKLWIQMQKSFIKDKGKDKLIVVEESGHQIHLDHPKFVIKAIKNMISKK